MNLKFLLIPLLLMSYTPTTYADEGLDISYKVPFAPLKIVFGSDGISFRGTKTIVTPIGSFSLGYSKYASKFDEDYTYVIIEDMNLKKEHIYKIKDKKKLKLVSEGRTEITVTKNRVRIVVEKESRFTVKFSVEGEDEVRESSGSGSKWFSPTNKEVTWKKAKQICKDNGGRLPTFTELKKVTKYCGGNLYTINEVAKYIKINLGKPLLTYLDSDDDTLHKQNTRNISHLYCCKNKGFSLKNFHKMYWSSSLFENSENTLWIGSPVLGFFGTAENNYSYSVRCIRDGQ